MTTVAVILARMDSARLPGKGLRTMAGRPMLQLLVERLRRCSGVDRIVLATTRRACDDPLRRWANHVEIDVYRGPLDDVLGRFAGAAAFAEADSVVKANGDNPLLAPEVIEAGLAAMRAQDLDFVTGKNAYTRLPVGLGAEIIRGQALQRLAHSAGEPFHREHVTTYVFDNPGAFRWSPIPVLSAWTAPGLSLSVDTAEDFRYVAGVVEALGETPFGQWTPELIVATARNIGYGRRSPEKAMSR
jgi:spore coat polysaccharide biosynthesis protein SpsF